MPRCVALRAAIVLLCLLLCPHNVLGAFKEAQGRFLANDDDINLFCLRSSYPGAFEINKAGIYELRLPGGAAVPCPALKASLAQPYALEPVRPDTPAGYAPGRERPCAFLAAMYGASKQEAGRRLKAVPFLGRKLSLAPEAARAFAQAAQELLRLPPQYRPWLIPEGAFHWRQIAGENKLSAHSWGIALDMGVKKAPYWRWAKIMPHPLQKSYPPEIVAIMERHGFIWGGKWHEYDLMHYEYRPEIICKARLLRALGR